MVTHLYCEYLPEPPAIGTRKPRFSWDEADQSTGFSPAAYFGTALFDESDWQLSTGAKVTK